MGLAEKAVLVGAGVQALAQLLGAGAGHRRRGEHYQVGLHLHRQAGEGVDAPDNDPPRAGVVGAALDAMADLGARAPYAVVGPSVCGRCYEVPEEMRAAAAAVEPASATVSWTGTPAIDVGAGVVAQLAGRGVPVTWVPGCTREDDRLFSYRRTSPTGRFAGAIRRYAVDPAYLIERPSHPTETS